MVLAFTFIKSIIISTSRTVNILDLKRLAIRPSSAMFVYDRLLTVVRENDVKSEHLVVIITVVNLFILTVKLPSGKKFYTNGFTAW